MNELLTQSTTPSPPVWYETQLASWIFELVSLLLAGLVGYFFGRRARKHQAELDRIAREEDRQHEAEQERRAREEVKRQEELRDWRDLISDMRMILRTDYAQYDDPERTRKARDEWDRKLERRLTGLAPFTDNLRARKIANRIRAEFGRLRETTFFFTNRDHSDRRWDEHYERFDIAWNEAMFMIAKLIEAIGGEMAPSREEWPGRLRHEDDQRDERELSPD